MINLLAVALCLCICMLVSIMVIWKFRKLKKIDFKYLLLGVSYYFVIRILVYPLLSVIFNNQNLLFKIGMDICYLGIISVFIKIILYKKNLQFKKNIQANILLVGVGEALAEIVFVLLPAMLNQFLLLITIHFGDIYGYFGGAYAKESIEKVMNDLHSTSVFYYIWVAVLAVSLIVINLYIMQHIDHISVKSWLFIICFYTNYLLVPIFSYELSLVILLSMDYLIMHQFNNDVTIWRRE
ncbi:MAG: hypothetical protein ACK5KR_01510 [Breznakia sp.]